MRKQIAFPRILFCILLSTLMSSLYADESTSAYDSPISMEQLLEQVKKGYQQDATENQKREQRFIEQETMQDERLKTLEAKIEALESESLNLESLFHENKQLITDKRSLQKNQFNILNKLFGHLMVGLVDLRGRIKNSIATHQFPDRLDTLDQLIKKANNAATLLTIGDIEQFWYELHRELTASAEIITYQAPSATDKQREIIRIGLFNLISDGEYLEYQPDTQHLSALPRQPKYLQKSATRLQSAQTVSPVLIDPTGAEGGILLRNLINTPTLPEYWHQGRQIGYIITAIGLFALCIAVWRFITLRKITSNIKRQIKQAKIIQNSPLGRILAIHQQHQSADVETLTLKLEECILKESATVQTGLAFLRIVAVVAPLLGLLGTVTGMIIVFQAITLYGTGDPQAMAGGISSALVTTVLGLIVAIPTLLAHTMLNSKAKEILYLLQEQSAGIIAERAEKSQAHNSA